MFCLKKCPTIILYPVIDPERYRVLEFNSGGKALKIEEKISANYDPHKLKWQNLIFELI